MAKWTRVDTTEGENLELPANASMRRIKADLGISGQRIVKVCQSDQCAQYRLVGTSYHITVTECF